MSFHTVFHVHVLKRVLINAPLGSVTWVLVVFGHVQRLNDAGPSISSTALHPYTLYFWIWAFSLERREDGMIEGFGTFDQALKDNQAIPMYKKAMSTYRLL